MQEFTIKQTILDYRSKEALEVCPVCKHGKAYQERRATNY